MTGSPRRTVAQGRHGAKAQQDLQISVGEGLSWEPPPRAGTRMMEFCKPSGRMPHRTKTERPEWRRCDPVGWRDRMRVRTIPGRIVPSRGCCQSCICFAIRWGAGAIDQPSTPGVRLARFAKSPLEPERSRAARSPHPNRSPVSRRWSAPAEAPARVARGLLRSPLPDSGTCLFRPG